MRCQRIDAALFGLVAWLGDPGACAPAQRPWEWALRPLDQRDVGVLHPLIQRVLAEERRGTRQPWRSPSGRHGFVYLEEGGEAAKAATATVRITAVGASGERTLYLFRYAKDPRRGWAVVG